MALSYTDVKTALDQASTATGGKFKPFDVNYYLSTNPDVANGYGADPLKHYVEVGAAEGRMPSAWFDGAFYRTYYAAKDPGITTLSGADLLVHYALFGAAEGRAPSAGFQNFDGARYLRENPDVAAYVNANLDQFNGSITNGAIAHYIEFGAMEGRKAFDVTGDLLKGTVAPSSLTLTPVAKDSVTSLSLDTYVGQTDLTGSKVVADGATAPTLRLTGDAHSRIDFTNTANQIRGIDLDGNGIIETNGVENNVASAGVITGKNFKYVDAYARNPLNEGDRSSNYLGDMDYDGTGYKGDGTNTNGNIVLGGLGSDDILGGVGNDFLAGGGVATGRYINQIINGTNQLIDTRTGQVAPGLSGPNSRGDYVQGGRNADFMFAELSLLDPTDGNATVYDGGNTADDTTAGVALPGTSSTQDNDWLLLEASDDDETTIVSVNSTGTGGLSTRAGRTATITDIENVDASGDMYGFLNNTSAVVGHRNQEVIDGRLAGRGTAAGQDGVGSENYGVGSSAQLNIQETTGTERNTFIGGYDNDYINGGANSDVLMGGKLQYLLNNRNNPNLLTADGKGLDLNVNAVGTVTDGRDQLLGGTSNDHIVFEMDGGVVEGGAATGLTGAGLTNVDARETDTLWVTNFSMGRVQGATRESEATDGQKAQDDALAKLTTDSVVRLDLGVGSAQAFRGYGGADVNNNFTTGTNFTADQTKYAAGVARTTVQDIESVITTGLGSIDFKAAGGNGAADQAVSVGPFRNQQNFFGSNEKYDLRGVDADEEAGTYTNYNGVFLDSSFGYNSNGTPVVDQILNPATNNLDPLMERGDNVLYANGKNDILEGRKGDDFLSGGMGDDTFFVSLTRGDDFDVVHRQVDAVDNTTGKAGADNLWDGTFGQDFRVKGVNVAGAPTIITFNLENPDAVQGIAVTLAGASLLAGGTDVNAATDLAGLATAVNAAFQLIDKNITAAVTGGKLVVTDATGRHADTAAVSGDPAFKNGLEGVSQGTGSSTTDELDRLVFKSYLDASANLGVDDSQNGLGGNAYAKDLVVDFTGGTTTLAERQEWRVQFQNLNVGDLVTVTVNGKAFSAKVGYNYDGSAIGGGETTDAFVTRFLDQFNARQLDTSSRAGDVIATSADVLTAPAVTTERVLILKENVSQPDAREHVFMSAPVVTITNGAGGSSGSYRIANNSETSVELYKFDGRDGNLHANDVLFVGQTGASSNYDVDGNLRTEDGSVYSQAILATAKTAGGVLTGKDATVATINGKITEMHGHDLLIGGDGADTITGLGGDDTIIGSKGTDSVDGGADAAATTVQTFVTGQTALTTLTNDANANNRVDYNDTLLFRESDFGDGSKFTVTLDGALASRGKGTVASVSSTGTALGTTTYNDIELVRTLNNTRSDTLDFSALSNTVASTTGASAEFNEGVDVQLTVASGFGVTYSVDLNADGDTLDAGEAAVLVGRVMGVENITGGNANDSVALDETQLDANNVISLGSQVVDTTPSVAAGNENGDTVVYSNSALLASELPTMTLKVEAATNQDTVSFTGGVLATATSTDTLNDVENLTVTTAAAGTANADVLDVSGITGATINYGTAEAVQKSLGGGQDVSLSVANIEINTLEAGGVSRTGNGMGNELVEITGITRMERVTGSTGTDRVIVADAMLTGVITAATVRGIVADNPLTSDGADVSKATYLGNAEIEVGDRGLYQFNLGAGSDDTLDYKQETQNVGVLVDTSATATTTTSADWVIIGTGADLTAAGERIDYSNDVERYFGSATAVNTIDLTQATVDTTVQFSKEAGNNSTPNEYAEPMGNDTVTTALLVRGAEVRGTTDSTVFARFMDRTAINPYSGNDYWTQVVGNAKAETVILTDNEQPVAHTMVLNGGANTVDYSARTSTVLGVVTAAFTQTVSTSAGLVLNNPTVTSNFTTDGDAVSITRATDSGTLTIIGSTQSTADVLDISGFGTLTSDAAGNSAVNSVDLRNSNGIVTENKGGKITGDGVGGVLNEDTALMGYTTTVRSFENVLGSGVKDAIYGGSGSSSSIVDGAGTDWIEGNGGADQIKLSVDATLDYLVYSSINDGDTTDSVAGGVLTAGTTAEADLVTNFNIGTDKITFSGSLIANIGSSALGQYGVSRVAASGAFNAANEGVLISTTAVAGVDFSASGLEISAANLATAVGAVANSAANREFIIAMKDDVLAGDTTVDSAIAYWKDIDGSGTVNALDNFQLLSVVKAANVTALASNFISRISGGTGAQQGATGFGVDQSASATYLVYTTANQSQGATHDTFINFRSGTDKIDLSGLAGRGWGLEAETGGARDVDNNRVDDAVQAILTPAVAQSLDADVDHANMFVDTTVASNPKRAVYMENTAGNNYRLFIDVNGDGNYTVTADMVMDVDTGGGAVALSDLIFFGY